MSDFYCPRCDGYISKTTDAPFVCPEGYLPANCGAQQMVPADTLKVLEIRHKNDVLLLVTGWLIGEGLKHGHAPPEEVIDMLASIGLKLYSKDPA